MDYRLDEIDRRIIFHLTRDARGVSAPEIADEVDVSAGTIRNRIRQLEDNGIIRGYHADVDYERVDGRIVNLFMANAPVSDREQLARAVLEVPGVVNVRELMSGRENLQITAVGDDTNDITRIAREIAELGIDIEDEALVQREHFHPYHQFGPDERAARTTLTDFRRLAGGAEVVDLTIVKESPVVGKSLKEIVGEGILEEEALVVAIERGDQIITPKGGTVIESGDVITVFSRDGIDGDTIRALTGRRTVAS